MHLPTDDDDVEEAREQALATNDATLRRLRRVSWPAHPPTFESVGEPSIPRGSPPSECSVVHAMRSGLVAARRFTCALGVDRFAAFEAISNAHRRTLIVHALDPAPSLPLLLNWTFANLERLIAFRVRLLAEMHCDLLFLLPADVPSAMRAKLSSLGIVRWVVPRYPAGSWRLMSHVAGTHPDRTLTLDAIAAVDAMQACESGTTANDRPIAIESAGGAPPRFLLASRGVTLADATRSSPAQWLAGPPLATHRVDPHAAIGDGELSFFRPAAEPDERLAATACIRCGECVTICPTRCDPVALMHVAASVDRRGARRAGLDACIDCGLCTAACPSLIPLHTIIASLRRGRVTRESA